MNILAIIGNPRLEGNTNYLVEKTLVEAAKLGARTEKIILNQYEVNPCLGHDGAFIARLVRRRSCGFGRA